MTTPLPLSNWQIGDFAPGEGVAARAFAHDFDDTGWIPARAPGDVHSALLAAGRIPDPFYDRNENECAWIEEREWWYRTTFTPTGAPLAADERLELDFAGLDTYATVWLNGVELGKAQNMFRPAVFDVSAGLLLNQPNTIALCIDRPLDHIAGFDLSHWWESSVPRVAMRKAQYGFGWDWGPRLPTVGIWRAVTLRRRTGGVLRGVHFATIEINPRDQSALLAVTVEAEALAADVELSALITLARDGEVVSQQLSLRLLPPTIIAAPNALYEAISHAATTYVTLAHPHLWWTWDLGEPALYRLNVYLRAGADEVDAHHADVGIRTITLDQSPDPEEPGARFFRFLLNGLPIFCRGANWIPAHSFVGPLSADCYADLVAMAQAANMNMLRVWGGGIYEHEAFYQQCSERGILVWQDFMFACAMYPEEPQWFVDEVAAEARYQVRRLRSNPCTALWCGNNENQQLHDDAFWHEPGRHLPGSLYYDTILPETVAALDGRTPYWPGSPFGGNDHNSEFDGDVHNWNAWHGKFFRQFGEEPRVENTPAGVSYRRYGEDRGRFISEFGLHAAPELASLRRVIPADQLYHHSPSLDHHNKDNPKNKGDNLMIAHTGLPATLDEYIEYSMTAQAEGLKFAIEHYRRRKPHCSGTLVWQFNDCWPVLSWSILDYYGVGKAGYWAVRRAYEPVLASFKGVVDGVGLWVTNDTLQPLRGHAHVSLRSLDGRTVWTRVLAIDVAANSSSEVWRDNVITDDSAHYLAVEAEGLFRPNRHFFAEIKDLALAHGAPQITLRASGEHTIFVSLRADHFLYFVHITGPQGVAFSDNYVDLEPGVEQVIRVQSEAPLSPDDLSVHWSLRQQ